MDQRKIFANQIVERTYGKPIHGKEFMSVDIDYSILHLAYCDVLFNKIRPQKVATLPVAFSCVFLLEHNAKFGMIHTSIMSSGGFCCKALTMLFYNHSELKELPLYLLIQQNLFIKNITCLLLFW